MTAEWKEWKVADLEKQNRLLVQDGNHGEYRPRKNEFVDEGVAFIRAADLGAGKVLFNEAQKINELAFQRIRKGVGKDLDTLLSTKGTVGKLSFVPADSPAFVCSPQTTFWRSLDHASIHPEFLYYELQSSFFHNQISSRKGETDMADYLSLTSQRGLSIRIPTMDVQLEVIKNLSPIDNKIHLNAQINQTLEQIAQAIFKSWFVDFDQVRAKMAVLESGGTKEEAERAAMGAISGKNEEELKVFKEENPEGYAELEETAGLFPSGFVDSELGAIPEGWEVKPLDKIAGYQNGLALQKFRPKSNENFLPVLKIAQLKKGYTDGEEKASANIKSECIVENGDVVFSWSGSLMVDVWCGGCVALNQHLFKVTSVKYPKWLFYYYTKHHLAEFQRIAADKAVTMGHIKREHLSQALCVLPTEELVIIGSNTIGEILEKQIEQKLENTSLVEMRDTLLPKLLSGEIELKIAEVAE